MTGKMINILLQKIYITFTYQCINLISNFIFYFKIIVYIIFFILNFLILFRIYLTKSLWKMCHYIPISQQLTTLVFNSVCTEFSQLNSRSKIARWCVARNVLKQRIHLYLFSFMFLHSD